MKQTLIKKHNRNCFILFLDLSRFRESMENNPRNMTFNQSHVQISKSSKSSMSVLANHVKLDSHVMN